MNDAVQSLTLYKFRPLSDCTMFGYVRTILETRKFWCSPIWDLNDPMEGVYFSDLPDNVVAELFKAKNSTVICSFSGESAFRLPTMWGHYANGFRGVAIQVRVDADKVLKVKYSEDIASYYRNRLQATRQNQLKRILATKLNCWRKENEYRFLAQSDEPRDFKIGEITGVHFGWPYSDIGNAVAVHDASKSLQAYRVRVRELYDIAKREGIRCFTAKISGNAVRSEDCLDTWLQ